MPLGITGKGRDEMAQTVKYAKVRATQDPDRGDAYGAHGGAGVYFGTNVPHRVALDNLSGATLDRIKTSRGACARG